MNSSPTSSTKSLNFQAALGSHCPSLRLFGCLIPSSHSASVQEMAVSLASLGRVEDLALALQEPEADAATSHATLHAKPRQSKTSDLDIRS